MADKTSIDYLPEVFQTPTNKKFLGSTLDQLVQEPKLKQTQGFIGKQDSLTDDTYINEFSLDRQNYQLEPGIVFKKDNKKVDALTYPGLVDGLQVQGSMVTNHNRLFSSETYSWDPMIDFDKFVNYSQYYWLPDGPLAVDVGSSNVFISNEFDIHRNEFTNSYNIEDFAGDNPSITLIRDGSYTFNVNQTNNGFYIQTQLGTDGKLPWSNNISSRDILGVQNNGEDNGTITFNVPSSDAQNFYFSLTDVGPVDIATMLRFDEVNGVFLRDLISLNDIRDLNAKTIVFLNQQAGDAYDTGWVFEELFSNKPNDTTPYAKSVPLVTNEERYQIFIIQLVYNENGNDPYIRLIPKQYVNENEKFIIQYGAEYSNRTFFKAANGYFEEQPLLTASLDRLFYQDANNPDMFGVINLINREVSTTLFIDEIIGQPTYTSPNGVEFTNGLKVIFRGLVEPESYNNIEYYVEGVGEAIRLIPVKSLVIPETYTRTLEETFDSIGFDMVGYNGSSNAPLDLDYITINRASNDLNAWSRSNRWFHIDVILKTAEYTKTTAVTDNNFRAKRPIIEFEPELRLFNFGTWGKTPINVVDFNQHDALSNVAGTSSYFVDGFSLETGHRVVFAVDLDPNVRNKIYTVEKVDMNGDGIRLINLTLADDANAEQNEVILVKNGLQWQGRSFSYDSGVWSESQLKTSVNQPPLFDVYDNNGISFSNLEVYKSTTFTGTKLFSYRIGNGTDDKFLGFPLAYLNISNLGDIVFDNNLYADTFLYVEGLKSNERSLDEGFLRQYNTRLLFDNKIGWVPSADFTHIPQIFNFKFKNEPIVLDVFPKQGLETPVITVYLNKKFITRDKYEVFLTDDNHTIITLQRVSPSGEILQIEIDDPLEIKIISDDVSDIAYYEIPKNLSSNVFNENAKLFTLGTIRNHFNSLAQNIINIQGNINGSNNVRDLGQIEKYGNVIIQNSAPMSLVMTFIRTNEYNFFDALSFNAQSYEKFKYRLLDWVAKHDIYELSASEILEQALIDINVGKNSNSSFFNSDMLPSGTNFIPITHEVTAISTDTFNTVQVYDFTQANNKALLVYVNDVLQVKDVEYTVATDGPRVTFIKELDIGDTIVFNEYDLSKGAMVPNTPTKLGLFKKFDPLFFLDNTYSTPTNVIRGHDGSISIAFNDIRDDVLLEFERRIFNNIKVNQNIPLLPSDIIEGQFRKTDYTDSETTEIMSPSLLNWLGWNRIDYKIQDYRADNELTWNYSKTGNKLDDKVLKGNWRGIYTYYYDTDSPHLRPWEMLGLGDAPLWWVLRYGPAPYTSGNKVLWDDLEAGLIKDPDGEYIDERYIRQGLSEVIPVDGEGNLLTPMQVMVGNYNRYDFRASWKIGDQSPAETAFRRSSSWPFAVQRLLALTKPAQYFALNVDRDRYQWDDDLNQYLYDNRLRLNSRNLEIVSNDTPKHSYVNWIADYNIHFGYESISNLSSVLNDTDINLCYRMASFTDKNNMKLFADRSSPDSANTSLLIPDESYDLLLYRNQPFEEIIYSAVTIQKVPDGFAVTGNSKSDPYFKIFQSIANGNFKEIRVGRTLTDSTLIKIPLDYTNNIVYIPYGFVFNNIHLVVDFLVSYGSYLTAQGLKFNQIENTVPVNWLEMAKEFVYWRDQGWSDGSIISLNPSSNIIEFNRDLSIVDSLLELSVNNQPQDQNKIQLSPNNYSINRINNSFSLTQLNESVLGFLNFNLTQFEHLLILDNVSIFNDLMYNPILGIRQSRIKLHGFVSAEWTGKIEAPGFLLNEDNIKEWTELNTYNKGNIVLYKNDYWTANNVIQSQRVFNFTEWTKLDYNTIATGMIANSATKSDAMLKYYDNHTANLESDADLLSLGITGFLPRRYLADMDLDDISQVNVYRNMIENKGTPNSLNLFKNVTFNNESTNYEIFENWAVRRAIYGASSSRAYVDFKLNENNHTSNPSLIEITNDISFSTSSNQNMSVNEIYKQSKKHTDSNIFPLLDEDITDISLPYAGFVDRNDIDIATFSLDNFFDIDSKNESIVDGTLIWVAKDTKYDWHVYRVTAIVPELIKVFDNLDGTLLFEFDGSHNIEKNSVIIIKYFDVQVNRTFNVIDNPHPNRLIVNGNLFSEQTQITDIGIGFVLTSIKVGVPSDISTTFYNNKLFLEDKVWVTDYNNKARVYSKEQRYNFTSEVHNVNRNQYNTNFSNKVTQNLNGSIAVTTESRDRTGVIHLYNQPSPGSLVFNSILELNDLFIYNNNNNDILNFGHSISSAETLTVIGADGNDGIVAIIEYSVLLNKFTIKQFLNAGGSTNFGTDVVISDNENWIYVSDINTVYAYQKVDYQHQEIDYIGDGSTDIFNYNEIIIINDNTVGQIIVEIDNIQQEPITDFNLDNGDVIFTTAPLHGEQIKFIRRSTSLTILPEVENIFTYSDLYMFNNAESVKVFVDDVLQRLNVDYTVTIDNITNVNTIIFNYVILADSILTVSTTDYFKYSGNITGALNVDFGYKIDTIADGSQLVVSAPKTNVNNIENVGRVYIYDRSMERTIVNDVSHVLYTANGITPDDQHLVYLNGVQLRTTNFNDYQYTVIPNGIILNLDNIKVSVGDFLDIAVNNFKLIQSTTISNVNKNANYGSSISIDSTKKYLYVGADQDNTNFIEGGSVQYLSNVPFIYGSITGTVKSPVISSTGTFRINRVPVSISAGQPVEVIVNIINDANIPNVKASLSNNQLVIELINKNLTSLSNKLDVAPGSGDVFYEIGLEPYNIEQTIISPNITNYAKFGTDVQQDNNHLIVSAINGVTRKLLRFDERTTTFDGITMRIIDDFNQSGAVYSFDVLPDATDLTPGKLVFGQQIYDTSASKSELFETADVTTITADSSLQFNGLKSQNFDISNLSVAPGSKFGSSVSIVNGVLLVGSPGHDHPLDNSGRIVIFRNPSNSSSWSILRTEQDQVDIRLINSVHLYDLQSKNVIQYLDYIDPLNGKIIGPAKQNLDYITTIDPATYGSSTHGIYWGERHIGELWWDITNVRFLDYHQADVNYANKLWGKIFPGSIVEVYQWIESDVLPEFYQGEGTPFNSSNFVAISNISSSNTIINKYYFWVKDIREISPNASKTLSAYNVASYIESPQSSGIPYASFIKQNIVGLTNSRHLMSENTTILHIEYDAILNDNNIFIEFDLIRENNKNDFLSSGLYNKMLESFAGVNLIGGSVPDRSLSISEQFGIEFRPRQSMFENRFLALESYIKKVNKLMANYTIAEGAVYPILNSAEPEPVFGSGVWDIKVNNLQELSYQNLEIVAPGFTILVENDVSNQNRWAIYEVSIIKTLILIRVQSYDTSQYWDYEDWYAPGFNSKTKIDRVVNTFSDLNTLNISNDLVVKVLFNSVNNWELYNFQDDTWIRVGLQDGTIEISAAIYDYSIGRFGFDVEVFDAQYFDQEPTTETRNIIRSINEEILSGNLLVERNKMLISVFNYIISEQHTVDWLYKTSLIDVNHKVRSLIPYSVYKKDNQDYVFKYIEETKPYHCKIKDFLLTYDGYETMEGTVTDFDCPSYYNNEFQQFISPILDDGAVLKTDPSNATVDNPIWRTQPWDQWFANRALVFSDVIITNPGTGYTIAPQVTVIGQSTITAELTARINAAGQVSSIIVDNPGEGYLSNPIIEISQGNGVGATAFAVTKNSLVRSFELTIKYDRYEYKSSVTEWQSENKLLVGDKVRYKDKAFEVIEANDDPTFVLNKYQLIPAEELSGIDRTMGYYVPDVNKPGLDLALLINGIAYPGVEVQDVGFAASNGWDEPQGWNVLPWDNASVNDAGFVSYSDTILDTIYESEFTDIYLGTRSTDINVVGGEFIDTYHSHAPEELIPGSTFDTLDFRVYSRPGSDYGNNGHAFRIDSIVYPVTGIQPYTYSWVDIAEMPVTVMVFNLSNGTTLNETLHYTVNWNIGTVTIVDGVEEFDFIKITVSGIGGGDQLYRRNVLGEDIHNNTYLIPVNKADIDKTIVYRNGFRISINVTAIDDYTSRLNFGTIIIDPTDIIIIVILGFGNDNNRNLYQQKVFDVGGRDDALFGTAEFGLSVFADPNSVLTQFFMPPRRIDNITAQMNAIVELNGIRLRSPEGIRYISDGVETVFALPVTGGIDPNNITPSTDVVVLENGVQLTYSADYRVVQGDGTVILEEPADINTRVEIYITSETVYEFIGLELILDNTPISGDVINVITYGDTSELFLLTELFQGPTNESSIVFDAFDQARFDQQLPLGSNVTTTDTTDISADNDRLINPIVCDKPEVTCTPFDQYEGANIDVNKFTLTQTVPLVNDRLWVTLNGYRLTAGSGYEINGNVLEILKDTLSPTDILLVTSMTDNVVSDGINFRYFKDMRDSRAIYSLNPGVETELTQDLLYDDDIIHIKDAEKLGATSLNIGKFGLVMINGERIMYRERDLINNTVSGLRRGTAGTAITSHNFESRVYDLGSDALVPDSMVSGGYNSFLHKDIIINGTSVSSIINVNTEGEETIEDDIMYVEDANNLSSLLFSRSTPSRGEIILGNYIITFFSKDEEANTISNLVAEKITYTPEKDDSNYPLNYSKGTYIKNYGLDYKFYSNSEANIPLEDQDTLQANFLRRTQHKKR